MSKPKHFALLLAAALAALTLATGLTSYSHAQDQKTEPPKTAEQQFKNIQALKGMPAEQLIPTMQFIAGSLGVDCEFCHVEHQMDKDDKKEKKTARKMIAMELAINKDNFDSNLNVTCYTCHRGSPHPVAIPLLGADAPKPVAHVHEESHAGLPAANELLDKYLAAVGGVDALHKIKTRVQKGSIDAMGHKSPIEVFSEAPDKRISISHMPDGNSVTAFNGQAGWLSMKTVHPMNSLEREAARIDAELYLPARLREMYKDFRVLPGETISGHATYLVSATGGSPHPALRLYFDQQTGLLLRLIRYTETPLGRLPAQVDYADYRDAAGVKIPYQWTLARPGGTFSIHVTEVLQNVPIDEKLFVPPPPPQEGKK